MQMRTLTRRLFFLVGFFALGGTTWLAAQNATISGVVLDQNKAPLTGATVVLEGTNYGAMTDGDGNDTIDGVKPGDYTLLVNYVSYDKFQQVLAVTAGEKMVVDIGMKLKSRTM